MAAGSADFPEVAGKVVDAQRASRVAPIETGDRARCDRMLRAGAAARNRQRHAQTEQATRQARERIAERGEQRADGEGRAAAQVLREAPRGQLQRRHRAGIDAAQDRQGRKVEPEFRLPHGQQRVDHVRIAVVHGVRNAGQPQYAPSGWRGLLHHGRGKTPAGASSFAPCERSLVAARGLAFTLDVSILWLRSRPIQLN